MKRKILAYILILLFIQCQLMPSLGFVDSVSFAMQETAATQAPSAFAAPVQPGGLNENTRINPKPTVRQSDDYDGNFDFNISDNYFVNLITSCDVTYTPSGPLVCLRTLRLIE